MSFSFDEGTSTPCAPDGGEPLSLSPDDAFTLLGNETRVAILRALWEAHEPYDSDTAVPFSELFDRVGVDDTGNFNYHLGRLTGHFVRRTESGYELTAPGFEIVHALVAGTATENPILEPAVVAANCPRCERRIEIVYTDGTVWARCPHCEGYWPQRGGEIFGFSLPPEGLRDRDPDEILEATIRYSIHRFESMNDGVCPECGGSVDGSLAVCEDHDPCDAICDRCSSYFAGVITFVCRSCKFAWRSPGWAPVHDHPALVSFYYDHGIEHVLDDWMAMKRSFDWREEVVSTDPPRLGVTVSYEGNERTFVLDETGTVVDVS
ncbi:hypothetical protein SAMN04487948_10196 [Halogranum amylolyticum]|uniref:Uncharacterized protein n=1 Tax=Halogranum amylolyticum TaxID=660520 RepID=A0A1H8MUL4_9EURY|nr:helix-turn-helix domain-containing protein [Halogranum amylolyticum]SEO20903.1 hypothetical protein SAMN04487948_10196 [Halogranum amylolyticum]